MLQLAATNPFASAARERRAMFGLWLAALVLRLVGIGYLLPYMPEPDDVYAMQPAMLRGEFWHPDYASYPLMVGKLLNAWPAGEAKFDASSHLDVHLERASSDALHARLLVACIASLAVPATWWLARNFLGAFASGIAALFVATSLMHVNFSQQGRPHAALAAMTTLALVAALRAARTDRKRDLVAASIAAALALGFLHSGLAAFLPIAAVLAFRGRPKTRGDWLRWAIPCVALGLALLEFYPYFFGGELAHWSKLSDGKVQLGGHYIRFAKFDGGGFKALALGLWRFDPVLAIASTVGAALAIASTVRLAAERTPIWRELLRRTAIVASFALPYAAVFGVFDGSLERFVLPLAPILALFAALGVERAFDALAASSIRFGRRLAIAFVALVFALPSYASIRLVSLRASPDTVQLLAERIRANPELRASPIWLQPNAELPLPCSLDALGIWRRAPLDFSRMFWMRRQIATRRELEPAFRFAPLPNYDRPFWRGLGANPYRAIGSLRRGWVACFSNVEDIHQEALDRLRAALDDVGRRELSIDAIDDAHRDAAGGEGSLLYQNAHFLAAVLAADRVGPKVELFRVEQGSVAARSRR